MFLNFGSKIFRHPNCIKAAAHRKCLNTVSLRSFATHNDIPTPTLFYIQHPWTWLKTKYHFSVLKSDWDPEFQEKDFKTGTKTVGI
jgi:hypothetical protein